LLGESAREHCVVDLTTVWDEGMDLNDEGTQNEITRDIIDVVIDMQSSRPNSQFVFVTWGPVSRIAAHIVMRELNEPIACVVHLGYSKNDSHTSHVSGLDAINFGFDCWEICRF
jgi:hypothetical protein